MSIRFHSQATAPILMLRRDGQRVLEAMGEPIQGKGILQPHEIGVAIEALERAAAAEREANAQAGVQEEGVTLQQRIVPLIVLLRRSEAAGEPVVWEA